MINWLTCSKKTTIRAGLNYLQGPRKMIEHAQLGALWFSGTPRKINGMYDKVLKTKARANPPAALRMWNSLLILRHFWSQKLGWRRLGFKNSLSSPWSFNKAPLPTASPAPAQNSAAHLCEQEILGVHPWPLKPCCAQERWSDKI
jgi:hypothetical protein